MHPDNVRTSQIVDKYVALMGRELAIAKNIPGNLASVHLDMETENDLIELADGATQEHGPKLTIVITITSDVTPQPEIAQ